MKKNITLAQAEVLEQVVKKLNKRPDSVEKVQKELFKLLNNVHFPYDRPASIKMAVLAIRSACLF